MTGNLAQRGTADPSSLSSRHEIVQAERALYHAQIAGSVDDLRPMLAADLVYIHSTGVAETREEYLEGVANGLYEYGSIETRNTPLQLFADVASMNGMHDMTVSAHGAAKQLIHLLFCLVWTRQDDAWRLDFRQATRMSSGKT